MRYFTRHATRWIMVWCMLLTGVAGCTQFGGDSGGGTVIPNPAAQDVMCNFSSDAELEAYIKDELAGNLQPTDGSRELFAVGDMASGDAVYSPDADASDFSQTNVQEAGVDESDTVKTDGTCFYIADRQAVNIVRAVPSDNMALLNTIPIDGMVDSLYYYNGMLAVLYLPDEELYYSWTDDSELFLIGTPYWIPFNARTGLLLVDVRNPFNPVPLLNVMIDGMPVSSRLTDGRLYLVQQFLPELPPIQQWYDGTEADRIVVAMENQLILDSVGLDDMVPFIEIRDGSGNPVSTQRLVDTQDFYHPLEPGGASMVTVTSFDLAAILSGNVDGTKPFKSIGVVADAHAIYASTRSLYLTANDWQEDGDDWQEFTRIHKFDISGTPVVYAGSGRVDGRLLNQFSMGEYEGVLRIATTTGFGWDGSSRNHVYCLESSAGSLATIGKIENLAPGETLYSARFMGARGFLVTFVQIDPLFTLDLSDPTEPKVAGELKVPGYSTYIHLLDDNHLLTIGKDAVVEEEWVLDQGVRLSIFDVTDLADPQLLHTVIIGDRGTESEAAYNPKAFTLWKQGNRNLLAIPVDLAETDTDPVDPEEYGLHTFSGLYVYEVTSGSGFELLGRISTAPATGEPYYYSWDWTRGIFIGDDVYAVLHDAVHAAAWADMDGGVHTITVE